MEVNQLIETAMFRGIFRTLSYIGDGAFLGDIQKVRSLKNT